MFKRGYSNCFFLQLSGYQDIAPLSLALYYQLWYIDRVLSSVRSVETCVSVEKLKSSPIIF